MTAMGSARVWPPVAALVAAVALAAVLAYVSTAVNRPPVIVTWTAQPAHVARHASAHLRVGATDPDGDTLRYEYKAERGRIAVDAARPKEARYTPPVDGQTSDHVTVTVTDTHGLTAVATARVTTEAAMPDTTATPPAPPASSVAASLQPTPPPTPAILVLPRAPTLTPRPASRAEPTPEAPEPLDPPPPAGPNHAPVLEKGSTIEKVGNGSVLLVANGYDPDGDLIEYEWDTKGCFDILQQSQSSAEVKFGYCTWGVVRLTWKDPGGLSAFSEWTISK